MLSMAISDHDAGRITDQHFHSVLQAAIDNGDILFGLEHAYVGAAIYPLIAADILRLSKHTKKFEL